MGAYLDSVHVYANLTEGLFDLAPYILGDITCRRGMGKDDPPTNDGLAGVGDMSFALNNASGYFGGTNLKAGWGEGTEVYLELTYESVPFIRYRGRVKSAKWNVTEWGGVVPVSVSDWMRVAMEFPITTPVIANNQTADQALTTILASMAAPPKATDFDTGSITFPSVFDTVRNRKTYAYSEFSKIQRSEFGAIYIVADRAHGETLVFESQAARYGWRPLDQINIPLVDGSALLKESGGYLRLIGGGKLLISHYTATDAQFTDTMLSDGSDQLENSAVINYLTVTAYPSRTDTSDQILFTLSEPIPIASGQNVNLRGSYANPSGGAPINGTSMITPVATTDYLVNTLQDGSGIDITADIIIGPTYYSASFWHQVYNSNANTGWITMFKCRGRGIYRDNPVSVVAEDATSAALYGEKTSSIDQTYNKTTLEGEWIADSIVELNKEPRLEKRELTYCPSTSRELIYFFLNIDVGWLVGVTDALANVDTWSYVQNVSFVVSPGGAVKEATYAIKPAPSLA